MADGQKMSNYTPLASGEKDYFFGTGEGSVVAVGKVSSGQPNANRLVKLSDIVGDKLPSGGTEGQVLTKTANGVAWDTPSGGGGYTRASASFTNMYMENEQSWQDLNVQNNTYTSVVWDNLDYGADHLKVKLPSGTDFPMCIIKFDVRTIAVNPNFEDIKVYNGTTQLTRIYPLQMLDGKRNLGDYEGLIASYSEYPFLRKGGYMEIHILGDSYMLYNNVGMTETPGTV